jgi:hypothetical protein
MFGIEIPMRDHATIQIEKVHKIFGATNQCYNQRDSKSAELCGKCNARGPKDEKIGIFDVRSIIADPFSNLWFTCVEPAHIFFLF